MLDEAFLAIASLQEVLNGKNPNLLDEWISHYSNSKIKEIKSFVKGILKDYTSVTNASMYPESHQMVAFIKFDEEPILSINQHI
ncbi:hypothetical protein [Clostridium sp. Marseille-Q7071]